MSGISEYTGTWNRDTAKHLAKRVMFGATKADVDYFLSQGLNNSVAGLLSSETNPAPPVNNYNALVPDPNIGYGSTWVNETTFPVVDNTIIVARRDSLKAWWTGQLLNQNRNLTQKMTFFWHNHFAIQMNAVPSGEACYKYVNLLMQNCFGNVKTLAKEITKDPAMLFFLNGYLNSASAPDENYARELQELFTVGKGPNSQYTEDDVQAAAKVLTGFRLNPNTAPITTYFDPNEHDNSSKTFSSFYGGTTIAGAGEAELDALLNMIFANDEVALYIVRKLYIYFVYYKIDAGVETDVIEPLANILRTNNYDILPVLETLFKSEHFYDTWNRSCEIKNPLDFMVGMCREMMVEFPDSPNHDTQYETWNYIRSQAEKNSLDIGDPPSVSGWIPYYQIPSFHELWINSDTYAKRNEFIDFILNGKTVGTATVKADILGFTAAFDNPSDPDALIQESFDLLLGLPLSQDAKDYFKDILLSGQATNSYWTSAWLDYSTTADTDPMYDTYKSVVENRLLTFYTDLLKQSEYQLK